MKFQQRRKPATFGIVTRLPAGRPRNLGSLAGRCKRFFPLQRLQSNAGCHWASCSKGYQGILPRDQSVQVLNLTTRLFLVSCLTSCRTKSPTPIFPICCVQGQLLFTADGCLCDWITLLWSVMKFISILIIYLHKHFWTTTNEFPPHPPIVCYVAQTIYTTVRF
jgi:hypothetical protein